MTLSNFTCQFAYDDLRGWLDEADKRGELRRVTGASWQEDIGMAAETVIKEDDGPAVLFDEVPGCPKGFRVLINVFAGQRRNMTLGFPDGLTKVELSDACYDAHVRDQTLIPPVEVETGPVFENIMEGDDIDLMKFPTPIWHAADGGRYIGTGCYSVTRDPETGWINLGTYRAMVHDKRSVGVLMVEGKHGHQHRQKYFAKGEPMPLAMVLGGDPVTFYGGCTEMPQGVCEYDLVGGMRGKPLEVVTGPVTGLPFPANAEIVLEGFLRQDVVKTEGPFGEWMGYYASGSHPEPVLDIVAIHHRNDPIILGVPPMGGGSDEMGRYRAILRSAMLKQNMQAAGVPDVTAVWSHEVGSSRMLQGVAIRQRYPGHARQAGAIAAQCRATNYANKYIIVVDDDIDVSNLEELWWAALTRSDPATSLQIIPGTWTSPADPRLTPEQREIGDITNSRAIIDACRPYHWRDQFPKVNAPTPEQARKAREKFGYLLKNGKGPAG